MAIQFTFNTEATEQSLSRFVANWRVNAKSATRQTFKVFVNNILYETLKFRDPKPLYYIRTLRLLNGWSKAAAEVGIAIPGPRGRGAAKAQADDSILKIVDMEEVVGYKAINRVPYALAVEDFGTKIAAAQGGGYRPPYRNVFTAREVLERNQVFERNLIGAWNGTRAN